MFEPLGPPTVSDGDIETHPTDSKLHAVHHGDTSDIGWRIESPKSFRHYTKMEADDSAYMLNPGFPAGYKLFVQYRKGRVAIPFIVCISHFPAFKY
jgi:hypothetical protein